jgi:chromosome segregation ATPase
MYPQGRDMPIEGQEAMISSHALPADTLQAEVSELRQGVREVASRLSDVEFDHAERSLLRGEVKSVEQRVTELVEDLRNRLQALEDRIPEPDLAETQPEPSGIAIEELAERLEKVETQLDRISAQPPAVNPATAEQIREAAIRQTRLEDRIDKLVAGVQQEAEARRPVEASLQELRQAVQNVTVRYSEIGELKKNHLVLQNDIETLRRDQATLLSQPANGTAARITQLESEVAALRAELRQTLKRLEAMEVDLTAKLQVARASPHGDADRAGVLSALAQLKSSVEGDKEAWTRQVEFFSSELRRFDDCNQALSTGLQETNDGLKGSCQRIDELISGVGALRQEVAQLSAQIQALQERSRRPVQARPSSQLSQVEGDLRAIREGLDQIRLFMQTLSQKI